MYEREDFEIYTFFRNGKQWYGFKVDYIGRWSAPTKEQILDQQKKIRKYVQKKLEWVERENQKYYARLAREECKRALLFKQAKQQEHQVKLIMETPTLTTQQKKQRSAIIYKMIANGATNDEIVHETKAPLQSIARLRFEYKKPRTKGERM